ncbi:hypothetical protein H0O03_04820 [Candidatus Micrarchaeota archaeon]|nr:hypothetical protein [Candidatus Micrarchaeota archaeon]
MAGPRLMEVKQPEVIENAPPSEPDWRIVDEYVPASSEKTDAAAEKKKGLFGRLAGWLGL